MKKALFTIISAIFILSAILLAYSLPLCGHGGFELTTTMNSSGCGGNMYDGHIAFLQTVFLAKLEWVIILILTLFMGVALSIVHRYLQQSNITLYIKEKLKLYYYNLAKPFDCLSLAFCTGRVYQRLLE